MRLDNVDMMLPIALLFVCGGLFYLWMRHPQSRRLATLMVVLVIADLLYFDVTGQWVAAPGGAGPEERAALAAMVVQGKGAGVPLHVAGERTLPRGESKPHQRVPSRRHSGAGDRFCPSAMARS